MCIHMCIHNIYIYAHMCVYIYIYIYIYIDIHIAASNPQPRSARTASGSIITVSFHNFKSEDFKLSVSNPTSKYVALFVRTVANFKLPESRPQKQT